MSCSHWIGLALANVLFACSPQAPAAGTAGRQSADLESEILARSEEFDAARQRGDQAAVDRLLADGYFFVDIGGRITDRSQSIASLGDLAARKAVEQQQMGRDEVRVHVYGDMAGVSSRVKWKEGDGFVANRNTRVWVKQAAEWRLAAQHASRIRAEQQVQESPERKP